MNKRYLTRIVTLMAYPHWDSPRTLLFKGTHVYTLPPKERAFVIRRVYYDDAMKPLYSSPDPYEHKYPSLQELQKRNPYIYDTLIKAPVLDDDNNLNVWKT